VTRNIKAAAPFRGRNPGYTPAKSDNLPPVQTFSASDKSPANPLLLSPSDQLLKIVVSAVRFLPLAIA
jgi:hypothetical protein